MLEQKDIEILKSLMQEVVKESEENILNKVDERIFCIRREHFKQSR